MWDPALAGFRNEDEVSTVASMGNQSFLRVSRQRWKIAVASPFVCIGGITAFADIYGLPSRFDDALTGMAVCVFPVFLAVGAFACLCAAIRCPRCRYKVLWHAVAKVGVAGWLVFLVKSETCPRCRYPQPVQTAPSDHAGQAGS